MASIVVRNLDDTLKKRLRMQAAEHGRSMEEEVRLILWRALTPVGAGDQRGIGTRLHARFSALGGVELDLPARSDLPRAPDMES